MLTDELLTSLFDGQSSHFLADSMARWLTSSRRFTAFVTAYHTKIRKKIRVAQEPESLRDLQLELETAYLLLRERTLSLEYEPQHPREGRSPDFTVTFTTSHVFMVEVTRMRSVQLKTSPEIQQQTSGMESPNISKRNHLLGDRFTDLVCDKLGQLLSQHSNLLVIGVEAMHLTHPDLNTAMLRIQQRAEGNDPGLLQRHGFRDRADFFHHYQRLSALLIRGIPLHSGEPVIIWLNPQAKYPLPSKVRTALSNSHTL